MGEVRTVVQPCVTSDARLLSGGTVVTPSQPRLSLRSSRLLAGCSLAVDILSKLSNREW
jgi:hypothetical protein